jgi:hypothetical protein
VAGYAGLFGVALLRTTAGLAPVALGDASTLGYLLAAGLLAAPTVAAVAAVTAHSRRAPSPRTNPMQPPATVPGMRAVQHRQGQRGDPTTTKGQDDADRADRHLRRRPGPRRAVRHPGPESVDRPGGTVAGPPALHRRSWLRHGTGWESSWRGRVPGRSGRKPFVSRVSSRHEAGRNRKEEQLSKVVMDMHLTLDGVMHGSRRHDRRPHATNSKGESMGQTRSSQVVSSTQGAPSPPAWRRPTLRGVHAAAAPARLVCSRTAQLVVDGGHLPTARLKPRAGTGLARPRVARPAVQRTDKGGC